MNIRRRVCPGNTLPCAPPAASACRSLRKWATIRNRQCCDGLGNKHFKAHAELCAAPRSPSALLFRISLLYFFPTQPTANVANYTRALLNAKHVQLHGVCVSVCARGGAVCASSGESLTLNKPCLWLCCPSHTPLPKVSSIWGGSITRS